MLPPFIKKLIRLHTLLATFFLPMGVMFVVTGALYTVDIKGDYRTKTLEVALDNPLTPDLEKLRALAAQFVADEGLSAPTGGARVREVGTSFAFEWSGANRDLVLAPTADPLVARVEVKDTTWYRRLVQLHKAKGGGWFKALAVAGAVGLLALFASGCVMAFQSESLRRQAAISLVAGLAVFFLLIFLS